MALVISDDELLGLPFRLPLVPQSVTLRVQRLSFGYWPLGVSMSLESLPLGPERTSEIPRLDPVGMRRHSPSEL